MGQRYAFPLGVLFVGLAALALSVLVTPHVFVRAGGEVLAALPARPGLPLTIRFIHSVQKTPVAEELRVDEAGRGFVLDATRYQSFGVGLPFLASEGSFRREGDHYVMAGMNRHFRELSLRTGVGTNLTLAVGGSKWRLYERYAPGTRIDLYIAPLYRRFGGE